MVEITAEQQEMMEKLKRMSPEELAVFQKKQCIFCQIIDGKIQSKKIYEDELTIAVLDINPAKAGHLLLMPKQHYAIMPQVPVKEIEHLGKITKTLSRAILKGLKVQGTTIFMANGAAAGQRAQHVMIHIIPRTENDDVGITINQQEIDEESLRKIRGIIKEKVDEGFSVNGKTGSVENETSSVKGKSKKSIGKGSNKRSKKSSKTQKKGVKPSTPPEDVSLDDIAGLFG